MRYATLVLTTLLIAMAVLALSVCSAAQSVTQGFQITVNAEPCAILTTPAPPNGIADGKTTYGPYQFAAAPSCGTVTWSLASGSGPLPTGLTLSSAGVLSGTIAISACAIGSCNFPVVVQATGPNAKLQIKMDMKLPAKPKQQALLKQIPGSIPDLRVIDSDSGIIWSCNDNSCKAQRSN